METEIPEEIKQKFATLVIGSLYSWDDLLTSKQACIDLFNAIVDHARKGYVTEAECQKRVEEAKRPVTHKEPMDIS